VPHWRRNDVTREVDLVEEVARIDGVESLPATLPARRRIAAARLTHAQRVRRRAEDVLVGLGLHEIAGWSFTDRATLARLRMPEDRPAIALVNPMAETQSILRPTIAGSLLGAAAHNLARGATRVGLFESAGVYRPGDTDDGLADEHHALAGLLVGPGATVLAAKGFVEAVLGTLRVPFAVEQASDWTYLHPGKSGAVLAGGQPVGFLGELHPLVARAWDIDQPAAMFAMDAGKLAAHAPASSAYEDLTSFPALRLDLAVVVADDVPAARVVEAVRGAGGPLLADAAVFDVYRSEQLGEGRVSLALHLEFRAADRTLTDEDVAPVREAIVAALRDQVGGELRG
jgi:phenylalanyl-tRNA synthetase beta chain